MLENKILLGIAVVITDVMLSFYKIAEKGVETHSKIVNPTPDDNLGQQANNILMTTVESIIKTAMVDATEKQRLREGYSVKELLSL